MKEHWAVVLEIPENGQFVVNSVFCISRGVSDESSEVMQLAFRKEFSDDRASRYDEFVDFIAAGPSSERVASFQPSETSRQRVLELLSREKSTGLSREETSELDHYLQLEHLMRLAKARARRHLTPRA